jgi:hypothetical protein
MKKAHLSVATEKTKLCRYLGQGALTEGKGSVQLTTTFR